MSTTFPRPPYPVNPDAPHEGWDYPDNRNARYVITETIDVECKHRYDPYESGGTIQLDAEEAEALAVALSAAAADLRTIS